MMLSGQQHSVPVNDVLLPLSNDILGGLIHGLLVAVGVIVGVGVG